LGNIFIGQYSSCICAKINSAWIVILCISAVSFC